MTQLTNNAQKLAISIFTQLELVFGNNQFKPLLSAQEKRIFDAMSKRNVTAWRAIAF